MRPTYLWQNLPLVVLLAFLFLHNSQAQIPALQMQGQMILRPKSQQADIYLWVRLSQDSLRHARQLAQMKARYQVIQGNSVVEEKGPDEFLLENLVVGQRDDGLVLRWSIQLREGSATVFVSVRDEQSRLQASTLIPAQFGRPRLRDTHYIADSQGIPFVRQFVLANESFQIQGQTNEELWVRYFGHTFSQAAPPMDLKGERTSPTLKVDSIFRIQSHRLISWQQEGLYLIQKDTNDIYGGIGLRVQKPPYPFADRTKESIIPPLVYISTPKEVQSLNEANELKPALDRYWLRMLNADPEKARQIIRLYYRQYKEANMMFTNYKEGWKTDKGMIFLIYGPPQQVSAGQDVEQWTYTNKNNFSKITFTFRRQANPFTDQHYVLVRYLEYEPLWYSAIEQWRQAHILRLLQ